MEFRVLGPLDVRSSSGKQIRFPRPGQRALLSLLLLRAGNTVTRSSLIDDLWGGRPPLNPGAALRNTVYEVRRVFGAPDHIETCGNGYLFRLGQDDYLDLHAFRELRAEGEKTLARGDLSLAAARLEEALNLWREPALADSPPHAVRYGTATALLEERALAQQMLIDVMLDLGRHRDAVVILYQLTASNPLRERWWELLMLALYRSGDQAASLQAFTQARGTLAEKCGIDPGPGLQSLQQRILAADPTLRQSDRTRLSVAAIPSPGFRIKEGVQGYSGGRPAGQWLEDSAKTYIRLVTRVSQIHSVNLVRCKDLLVS